MARTKNRYAEQAEKLADILRDARAETKLSQQQLAQKAGISIGTVRNIEQGVVKDPGFFEVAALAQALNLEMNKLTRRPRGRPHSSSVNRST